MASTNNNSDGYGKTDGERRTEANRTLWDLAGTLYARRFFIIAVTFGIAVTSAVITLMIPNYYRASSTVLIPESTGGGLGAAIFRNLPSVASSLLGGSSGDFVRYMAILNSRHVMGTVVDSFDLVKVYDVAEEKNPREAAISILREHTAIELDIEFDYLEISVTDTDPDRAARMANMLVRRLNDKNASLSSQNAADYRRFVEHRYMEARTAMDSVLDATAAFQKAHGVFDLPTQAEGFFEQVGELRAKALEAEIQYEALRAQYGADNPRVEGYREVVEAANRKYVSALRGEEQLLPVAKSDVPAVGRQYVDLEIERIIQQTILEVLGPMYEHARLQEEQETQAVQVLDAAIPPSYKAGPKRTIIVIASALSAFILSVLFVLVLAWWRRNHAAVIGRLQAEASQERKVESVVGR